jgi:hypothetical protein
VPSIATGWSHKYRYLLEEYGCPDHLVDVQDKASLGRLFAECNGEARRSEIQAQLQACAEEQRRKTEVMWDEVRSLLRAG